MYQIIGYPKDNPKKQWLHSTGYYDPKKAQNKIDSGDVKNYLMPEFKDHIFEVREY